MTWISPKINWSSKSTSRRSFWVTVLSRNTFKIARICSNFYFLCASVELLCPTLRPCIWQLWWNGSDLMAFWLCWFVRFSIIVSSDSFTKIRWVKILINHRIFEDPKTCIFTERGTERHDLELSLVLVTCRSPKGFPFHHDECGKVVRNQSFLHWTVEPRNLCDCKFDCNFLKIW